MPGILANSGRFAFDAATGAVLWRSSFDLGSPQEDIPVGVVVSRYGPRSFDLAVFAYEA
jgi:hypothetical protein